MHVFVKITYCSFLGCSQESIEGLICFTFPESNLKGMKGDTQLNQKFKKKKKKNQQTTTYNAHTQKICPPPQTIQPKKGQREKRKLGPIKKSTFINLTACLMMCQTGYFKLQATNSALH